MNPFKDMALHLLERGLYLEPSLSLDMERIGALKTYDYFLFALNQSVGDLYNGKITEDDFSGNLADLLEQQLRRAWNEGMRANDLDPATDMTDEWEAIYQEAVLAQYEYIEQFAADIAQGAEDGAGSAQFKARAASWANRYNDMVSTSTLETADKKDRLIWEMGATEQHCVTCSSLNGIIAWAEEWEISGFHPQGAQNDLLSCGGWKCDCRLSPTDRRRSPNALDRLLDIATAGSV
jgi:hypothetical protein